MPCSRSGSTVSSGCDLDACLTGFLATLADAGYSKKSQDDKRRAIAVFIDWVQEELQSGADLEACARTFLSRPSRPLWRDRLIRTALPQFVAYLQMLGVAPSICSEPSPSEVLIRRYVDYLRDSRGLCKRSIEVYLPFVRAFVAAQRLPERMRGVDGLAVRNHVLEQCRGRSISFVRLLTAALRSFLRFCFLDATTPPDLWMAVPPVRRWRHAPVPPFLTAEEIERVIAMTDRATSRGRRAIAILLLLARLGLRAGEIVALELDDISWDAGEILVRGKGRLLDRLPLPADVGEALVLYLREARGPSKSRRVFLRRIAPPVGLAGPSAVCEIARQALRRAGLMPAGRVAAHIFRRSLATEMIRRGASLAEISQVLRHRSVNSSQIYAMVDVDALRGVALPWPCAEALR